MVVSLGHLTRNIPPKQLAQLSTGQASMKASTACAVAEGA